MTKIKICGITREADAHAAIELGADALGFVFCEQSQRDISQKDITWIRRLPPFVQLVGLFVNPDEAVVRHVTETLPIELLQFHGQETATFCQQFSSRYIKAVPMQNATKDQASHYMEQHPQAAGFLLDNYGVTEIGGSGSAFDWQQIPQHPAAPITLAGGLTVENVSTVIQRIRPYAVDVSSGVEDAPGIKSVHKMAAFIQAVKSAS